MPGWVPPPRGHRCHRCLTRVCFHPLTCVCFLNRSEHFWLMRTRKPECQSKGLLRTASPLGRKLQQPLPALHLDDYLWCIAFECRRGGLQSDGPPPKLWEKLRNNCSFGSEKLRSGLLSGQGKGRQKLQNRVESQKKKKFHISVINFHNFD